MRLVDMIAYGDDFKNLFEDLLDFTTANYDIHKIKVSYGVLNSNYSIRVDYQNENLDNCMRFVFSGPFVSMS
jgi:hypothetical protein